MHKQTFKLPDQSGILRVKHSAVITRGFSLIELLMVIAIVSILSGIAYPSYQSQLIKARRADGQIALLHLAARLEQYALTNNGYQDASLSKLQSNAVSKEGYYQLSIIQADRQHYVIAANAIKGQAKDKHCAHLAINDLSEKGTLQGNTVLPDKTCW